MADLIELDLVVRDKGLKQSVSTVERLERQLIKAAKAVEQNRISQERYNKILLQSKREYQALGMSSQKATAQVRKFAEAQREAGRAAEYHQQQVGFAGKKVNRMGMQMQQAGYQVGDFAVQIQGGTNAAVALGQQGAQLLGIFGPAGAIAGAALAITTAFIAPLLSARKAASSFKDELKEVNTELDLLRSGAENSGILEINKQIATLVGEIADLKDPVKQFGEGWDEFMDPKQRASILRALEFEVLAEGTILNEKTKQLENLRLQKQALEIIKGLMGDQVSEAENLREVERYNNQQRIAEQKELYKVAQKEASRRSKIREADNASYAKDTLNQIKQWHSAYVKETERVEDESRDRRRDKEEAYINDMAAFFLAAQERNRKLYYAQFSAEDELMSQDVVTGSLTDRFGVSDLLNMGYTKEYLIAIGKMTDETKKLEDGMTDAEKAAEELRKELEAPMVKAIDSVSNAFGDFIADGLRDFKSFASSIVNSFKSMIAQMIATAARNKIMLSLGMGGSGFAAQAAAGNVAGIGGNAAFGPIGSFMGSFAGGGAAGTGLLGGIGSVFGSGGIGLGGSFGSLGTLLSGGSSVAAGGTGFAATLGAAIPAIAAVAVVIGLFTKKTKLLDSGLRTTVEGFDIAIETFKKTQTSRLFGLLKGSKKTSYEAASAEVADPLIEAIGDMQQRIVDAAGTLGIGAEAFDDFSYQFKLSLKGLTEEEQLQKINEEITKMGDSFASLTGIFSNMNELLSVAQERYNLEVQLLQVQGDVVELRRRELEAINVLNRGLAARLQLLQAEGELQGALAAFAAGISEQQGLIRRAVDALVSPLIEAINRTKTQAEKSYAIFRAAADNTRSEAQNIVDIIAGALSSRTIQSEAVELLRYRQAQQQLSSFADGASFDESSLRKATEGVSVDSTKFFGSFEDYARDFYKTQISLTKLAEKAEGELTDVEKQIDVAEKAYQVAMGTYEEAQDFNVALNTLIDDLATFTEVAARNEPFIDQIKAEGDRQVELLDSILVETTKQINALSGIDDTIADLVGSNVSVGEALSVLGLEGGELAGAVLALDPTIGAIGSHVEALDLTLSGAIDRLGLTLSELEGLDLSEGFLSLDLTSGLETNILGLTTEVSALDTAASGLNLGVVGLDGTIGILVSSVDKQASNILTLDGTVVSQTVAVDALSGEVSYLASNVVNLDGTVYGLGTNVSDLGMSTDNLGININDLGTTLSNAMSGLGSIVSGLSGAVSALAASNDALASAQKSAAEAQVNAAVAQITSPIQGNVQSKAEAEAALIAAQEALLSTSTTKTETYKYGGFFGLFRKTGTRIVENPAYAQLQDDIEKLSETIAKEEAILAPAREQIKALGVTPEFASGGMHSGGMRLVGERGPELEVTGPSRIYSAQQTKNMLSGGSGEVVSELRSLRREVSELKSEQRKVGVENVKYNKKSYDLYREWDTIGLPATRTS